MLIETTLFEHYNMCLKSETEVTAILTHATRLRHFLFTRKRFDQVEILENRTSEIFFKNWGTSLTKTVTKSIKYTSSAF